jgi:hypothetical protein
MDKYQRQEVVSIIMNTFVFIPQNIYLLQTNWVYRIN